MPHAASNRCKYCYYFCLERDFIFPRLFGRWKRASACLCVLPVAFIVHVAAFGGRPTGALVGWYAAMRIISITLFRVLATFCFCVFWLFFSSLRPTHTHTHFWSPLRMVVYSSFNLNFFVLNPIRPLLLLSFLALESTLCMAAPT